MAVPACALPDLIPVPVSRAVGVPAWKVASRSHPGHFHTITRSMTGALLCTCTAGRYGQRCAHVRAIADLVAAQPLRLVTGDSSMVTDHAVAPLTHAASNEVSWETMEVVLGSGDLAKLTARQKVEYYRSTCDSLGLNWRTMPFRFITFERGGTQLYAQRGATDQLRRVNGVTIVSLETELRGDHYIATARARDAHGREDVDIGVVAIKGLGGLDLANAMKRAITQAKRRVTLSICGLAFLDESEAPDVPRAALLDVDIDTGEVLGALQPVAPSPTSTAHEISGKREPTASSRATSTPVPTEPPGDPRPTNEQVARFKADTQQALDSVRWTAAGIGWLIGVLYSKKHSGELTGTQADVIRMAIRDWAEADLRQLVADLYGDRANTVLTNDQHRQLLGIIHGAVDVAFDPTGKYTVAANETERADAEPWEVDPAVDTA